MQRKRKQAERNGDQQRRLKFEVWLAGSSKTYKEKLLTEISIA